MREGEKETGTGGRKTDTKERGKHSQSGEERSRDSGRAREHRWGLGRGVATPNPGCGLQVRRAQKPPRVVRELWW